MFGFWVEMLDTGFVSCYDPQEEVWSFPFPGLHLCELWRDDLHAHSLQLMLPCILIKQTTHLHIFVTESYFGQLMHF
jgi:hypothetical protein